MDVQGKRVIVTGGFGALGRAVGHDLAGAGARVALLDRANAPEGIADKAGVALALGGVELGDPEAAAAAIDQAASAMGGLDALVNIAGAFRWETLADGDVATWEFLFTANVKTAVSTSKAALPHLAKSGSGRIVNIGAGAAARAGAGMGAYAASKSGVARLTEALAEEQKGVITVNAILPSIIDTPANRKDMPDADFSSWVTPDEIADTIRFLLSECRARRHRRADRCAGPRLNWGETICATPRSARPCLPRCCSWPCWCSGSSAGSSGCSPSDIKPAIARAAQYHVTIKRDTYGVPHVEGQTDADVAFGFGYAHSEDDFETIQEWRWRCAASLPRPKA